MNLPHNPEIVQNPAYILRQKTQRVIRFDRRLRKLKHLMLSTMYDVQGVGLAAPQINLGLSFFVYDDKAGHRGAIANPELTPVGFDVLSKDEGCLSVKRGKDWQPVRRWTSVRIVGQDETGEPVDKVVGHFLARIFQHETDHLNGVLFLDRVKEPVA